MRRLLALGAAVWLTRWALRELASYAARSGRVPRARPRDDRQPGRMPRRLFVR